MTKNSRQKAKKKTVAKNAVKANQRKLQKRAQTDNVTAKLDKDLGLVYSVGVFLQSEKSDLKVFSSRSSRQNRQIMYRIIPPRWAGLLKNS